MDDRILSTLGICRKAGKLVMGFDAVREATAAGQVYLIVLAGDLSEKSGKEISFQAAKKGTAILEVPFTMDDIKTRLGKRSGILGITDSGLAGTVQRTAQRANEED